jgi:CrcB protein
MTWMSLPYVFIGGGLGASLRWGLALLFKELNFSLWGSTLLVNCLGTAFYFLSLKSPNSDFTQHLLRFGLFGALTTFSTLSYEVASAVKSGQYGTALAIFFLNIFAGVLIAIGMFR